MTNRSEEFMLTLPSNASIKYYPSNKPNSYKVLLPATLDLDGTWEVAIVNIQYPFNWPNFNEEFVAFVVSVKESEAVREKQAEQQATEGDTPLAYFKAQFRLSSMQHPLDPNDKKLYDYGTEYAKQIGGEIDGTKLLKIPTGYYDSHASLGKYLDNELAKNLPIKGHEELSACQIHCSYDNVTQKISLSTKILVKFRIFPLNDRFTAHIGAGCTPWEIKMFLTDPNCFRVRRAFFSQRHDNIYLLRRSKISNHWSYPGSLTCYSSNSRDPK